MLIGNQQRTTEIELISETEGRGYNAQDSFSAVLSKSMEQNNSGTSEIQDNPETIERIDGVAIGHLVKGGTASGVWVDYPDNPSGTPLIAVSTVPVTNNDIGREVALAFEMGDPTRPILIGIIHHPRKGDHKSDTTAAVNTAESVNVQLDGERLTFTGDQEIILRCGKASITLTRAGKVLIRGAYVLSRSSGVNRMLGGSVQLN
jgi:hypothetical protein